MKMQASFRCLVAFLTPFALGAEGQEFNIDTGLGQSPNQGYGAVPAQAGFWNAASTTFVALKSTDGQSTPSSFFADFRGLSSLGISSSDPDEQYMMNSAMLFGSPSNSCGVTNMQPGFYDVYVYCSGGNGPSVIKVSTGVSSFQQSVPNQTGWPGSQIEGVTYIKARVQTTTAAPLIAIQYLQASDLSPLNGIQIVPVPTPGCASLMLGTALCFGQRRRRSV